MQTFSSLRIPRSKLGVLVLLGCAFIGLFVAFFPLGHSEPKSRMRLTVDAALKDQIAFVLTNPTKHPSAIIVQGIEISSNGVWIPVPSSGNNHKQIVLNSGKSMKVPIDGSPTFPWRARFTSIEKNVGLSGMGYRLHWMLERVRSGKGFSIPKGEVYHDVELVSEEMPSIKIHQ